MENTELLIQNMVCDRCVKAVRNTLSELGYPVGAVELGSAVIETAVERKDLARINDALRREGFGVVHTRDEQIAEQVRTTLIRYVAALEDGIDPGPVAKVLSRSVHASPSTIGRLFSKTHGLTVQRFLIRLKIERAKDLITRSDLTSADIADRLGYSSTQHLSTQFKSVTGKTIMEWKEMPGPRIPLDQL